VGSNGGLIQQSYATGAVSSNGNRVGGLVGGHSGNIQLSYATGAVSGVNDVGGLVGYHTNNGSIAQTYAAGAVSGVSAVGGLVGTSNNSAVIAQSYWDTVTSGQAIGVGSGPTTGATGLTTSQMQDSTTYAATYTGWNFANVWSAPSAGYYPQLYGVNYVLRVDSANASRAYGDANPAFTYTSYGLHTGDTSAILSGLSLSTAATATSNVGSYAITAGGSVVSTTGQAYRLIQTPATLTVTPRAITVTADAKSRIYGDANPVLTYQVGGSGLANGDMLSGALATSATTASNVGTYGITQGTLAASGNYALSYTGDNLTVGQRAIMVIADAQSRSYGDANPVLTYQIASSGGPGLVNGDTLSGALATSATTASNVGTYGIAQGTLAASGNYALSYTGDNLTVGQRAITVTADAQSRAYGDANPALTYQVGGAGLVNGDTLSGTLATSATTASNVGTYGITQGTLAASGNYALNYTGNNLTVGQRAITVTADAQSRAYGDANPALTYQVGGAGLVNGDTLSGALATSATTASNVGTYGITQGTLAASGNYTVNYTGNNLTIGQRAITVTADAQSRAYGDVNPALTYQVGGAGLVNGDTLSGALATSATTASNVGTYGITQGTLAASGNYALNYTGNNLTVGQRAITVTADAQSRAYGDVNPALTYQVGGAGLVNGDTLSGALATSATTASNVGTYGITQGTLAASGNYALGFVGANLTVTPAAAPRVPTAELVSYARSRTSLPAPQPPEQMRDPASVEQAASAIVCKARECLELPHPHNRRIGARARFVDTANGRGRLPAFADN
jgi:hypothetical protein